MKDKENQTAFDKLVLELSKGLSSGQPLTGKDGVFTPLLKRVIEASLEGEMDAHLEQSKTEKNRRNGRGQKNINSSFGGFDIFSPRDRNGSFQPEIVRKRQRRITEDIDKGLAFLKK